MDKVVLTLKVSVILMLSLFYLFINPSYGQEQEELNSPKTITELQIAIEKVLDETETPAVGLALVNREGPIWLAGLGKADIEKDADANENTMFRIGSTSKMFVSLAILKLQEEGRLSLKDKVRDLVPKIQFKNPWEESSPILVEHLLEHTTGWDDIHLTEYAHNNPKPVSLKEGLDFHPHSRISRWIPGTRMSYCNAGPAVAAYIVEKISGQSFEDYIQENFFQPMGMETMTYLASKSYMKLGATLYIDGKPQDYWHIIMRPSGAINASPNDMAKMVQFFINRGQVDSLQLISKESLKRMETPTTTLGAKAGLEVGYGLSNYSSPYKSFIYRSHNGGVNGGLTDFAYLPDYNIGYTVMINSGNVVALNRIANLIRDFQLKDVQVEKINRIKKLVYQEATIAGYYIPINPRNQMFYFLDRILNVQHIWHNEDSVIRKGLMGGQIQKYLPLNDTCYKSAETGKISMVKVEDPLAGEVVHADIQVLKRVSPWLVFGQLILGALWILFMITAIIFGMIWSIRYWLGKISGGPNIWVRLWPFIASFLFLMVPIAMIIGAKNLFELLGKMSFVSISIMIFTFCFALASGWSVVNVIKERHAKMNKFIYWHSAVLSGLHLLVTCYLLWYGVIGIQTWR